MRARLLLVAALALAAPALAQNAPERVSYNVVELQAEAQREIANDLLQATMFTEMTDADPAKLAAALNRAINAALASAKAFTAVTPRSGGYQTYPVYDRSQRLTGWRGRAEVRLESRDFEAASSLIAKLQSTLQLASLAFGVSPEARRDAQDQLIAEAVAAFRARADIARRAMGAKAYKIRRISLNTGGAFPPPRPVQMRAMAQAEAVPPPQFEGGTSRITVAASGAIEVE